MTRHEKIEAAWVVIGTTAIIIAFLWGLAAIGGRHTVEFQHVPAVESAEDTAPAYSVTGAPITLVETFYSDGQPTWTYTTYEDGTRWIDCHSEECHNAGHVQ